MKGIMRVALAGIILGSILIMCAPAPVSAVNPITRTFYPTYNDRFYTSSGTGTYYAYAYASKYTGDLKGRIRVENPPWPTTASAFANSKINVRDTVPFDSYITVRINFQLQYYMKAEGFFVSSRLYVMWEYSDDEWAHPAYPCMWMYLYDSGTIGGTGFWPLYPVSASKWHPWKSYTITVETEDHLKDLRDWLPEDMVGYTIISLYMNNNNGGYVQWSSSSQTPAKCKVNWIEITYYPKYWN